MNIVLRLMTLMVFGLFLSIPQVQAATGFSINWKHPTTREDGSVLKDTERQRYQLYSKPVGSTTYAAQPVMVTAGTSTTLVYYPTVLPKTSGNWCFALTTVDTGNLESKKSPDFCIAYKAPVSKPKRPTGFKAQ